MGNAGCCRCGHCIAVTDRIGEDDDGDATAGAAFGRTAAVAKMDIMCLQNKCWGKVSFTVTAGGQAYKQYPGLCTRTRLSALKEISVSR